MTENHAPAQVTNDKIPLLIKHRWIAFGYITMVNSALLLGILMRGDLRPYHGLLGFIVVLALLAYQFRCFSFLRRMSRKYAWFMPIVVVMSLLILLSQLMSIDEIYIPFYVACIFVAYRMAIAKQKPFDQNNLIEPAANRPAAGGHH